NGHVALWLAFARNPGAALDAALRDPMWIMLGSFAVIAVLLIVVWLTVRWTQRRPFSSVSSVVGGLRWGWLAASLGFAVALLIAAFTVAGIYGSARGTGPGFPGWERYVVIVAVSLV